MGKNYEEAKILYYTRLVTSGAAGNIGPDRANAMLCLTRTGSKGVFTAVAVASTILGVILVGLDGNKVIDALFLSAGMTRMKVSITMAKRTQRSMSSRWRNRLQRNRRKRQPRASARLACEDAPRALWILRSGRARPDRVGVRSWSLRGRIRPDLSRKGLVYGKVGFCR